MCLAMGARQALPLMSEGTPAAADSPSLGSPTCAREAQLAELQGGLKFGGTSSFPVVLVVLILRIFRLPLSNRNLPCSSMFYHMNHVLKRYKAAMKSSRAETFQNFRRMRTLVHQVGMSVLWHRELAGSDSPAASTNVAADHWPLRRQYQLEVAYQEDWA